MKRGKEEKRGKRKKGKEKKEMGKTQFRSKYYTVSTEIKMKDPIRLLGDKCIEILNKL